METDGEISVLICGFGAFGAIHAEAWRRCGHGIRLLAADPSPEAQQRALRAGIKPEDIATAPEILITRADIVDIVAPPALHLPLALLALQADRPVLIEKPAVTSREDAQVLLAASARQPVQIGFVLRSHPLIKRMRALLADGEIGRLVAMEADTSGWKRMRADSSLLENDGVHMIDLMRHLSSTPAISADARATAHLGETVKDDIRIELTFQNGVQARLRLGVLACGTAEDPFVPGAVTTKQLRLIGTKGNLLLDFNTNRLKLAQVSYVPSPGGYDVRPGRFEEEAVFGQTPVALLAGSFRQFLEAVQQRGPVMCNVQEGALEMAAMLETIETAMHRPARAPLPVAGEAR